MAALGTSGGNTMYEMVLSVIGQELGGIVTAHEDLVFDSVSFRFKGQRYTIDKEGLSLMSPGELRSLLIKQFGGQEERLKTTALDELKAHKKTHATDSWVEEYKRKAGL